MNYRGVIFDLDDTLFDFGANSAAALRQIGQWIRERTALQQVDEATFLKHYKRNNERLWTEYRAGKRTSRSINATRFILTARDLGYSMTEDEGAECAAYFLDTLYSGRIMIEGALDILAYLKPNYRLGLITNGFAAGLKRLGPTGLAPYLDYAISSEQYGHPKPHAGIFHHTVEKLGGQPRDYLYVGDNYSGDVVGAKAAGLGAVFFNIHGKDCSSEVVQPDFTIGKLMEMREFL